MSCARLIRPPHLPRLLLVKPDVAAKEIPASILGNRDALLAGPLGIRHQVLQLLGLLELALLPEIIHSSGGAGEDVAHTRYAAVSAGVQRRQEIITASAVDAKLLGAEDARQSCELAHVAARQLRGGDVGVFRQCGELIRVEINTSRDSWEVVDNDGDGRVICDFFEVRYQSR
ncbi:unnamed protein product [Clonostachys chloroleuca]|uniref:Uncharacterized protein n=1 Tax=Clonostachys chloroleuca TaxID=1926264 RepID=A0AA35MJ32_9HYPO|nr:unnamed protein product [Clonostachys chloroleuca]